mgnify:CR=1 FL=1|tara:strand:+ start:91 stop:1059 length:969 start_codon:yes stop_codon:yes gene_type:complete
MKNYDLVECLDVAEWDPFLKTSPQNNILSHSWFLLERKRKYIFYFILEKNVKIAAVIISLDSEGNAMPNPWTYHGIFFSSQFSSQNNHRYVNNYLKIIEFLVGELSSKINLISFNLHPTINDMRPFQWFKFNNEKKYSISVHINYTSILDINYYENFQSYLSCVRKVRRQEYRKCTNEGFKLEISKDLSILNKLHADTFERQGLKRNDHDILLCNEIASKAFDNDSGQLIYCKDKNNNVLAGALFLFDKKSCYYLIGATDEKYKKYAPMTFIITEQIKNLFNSEVSHFDFCGINSPNRGDYKTSFNGSIVPYFTPLIKKINS